MLPEVSTGKDHGPGVHLVDEESQRPSFGIPAPVKLRTMIAGHWRITLYEHASHAELYNLKNDPDENHNLWNHPDHQKTKTELLEGMVRASIHSLDASPAPRRRA